MHMPPHAVSDNILKPDAKTADLWRELAPQHWPIPLTALPNGTALVGGAVRDALLGRLNKKPDLDLVVPNGALALSQSLAGTLGGSSVVLDEQRDIARLVINGWTIDLARCDGESIDDDLWRRDFRLNAIALPLRPAGALIDPTGGQEDLQRGQLVAVSERNLTDDPLRLLRGLRLLAEIPLDLDQQTAVWIKTHRTRLTDVAPERILNELQRLVTADHFDNVWSVLLELELLKPWNNLEGNTELHRSPPRLSETFGMTDDERALALPLARWIHLSSDSGLEQLRASRQLQRRCRRLRHWIQLVSGQQDRLTEVQRVQLHLELDEDLPALILHLPQEIGRTWLTRWRNPSDPLFHPTSPVDGSMLQNALGLSPGPVLGRLLHHLRHERAFGRVNGHASAITEAKRWFSLQSDLL